MGALIAASAVLLCISVILVVLLSRNQAQATTDSGYSERPKNQTVAQGQTATFRCQHQEAVVGWKVNGTSWTPSSELVGISNEVETVNGRVVSLLHIDGIAEYNSTTVTCDGFFEDGRPNDESVALLWIQGPLNSPDHLTRTSVNNITWKAPHSLDITDTELDIVYCVDVIDITCVEEEFLFSDCHVTATYISSGLHRDGHIYRITVTPRSNVVGSLNGTPIVLEENFTLYRRPYVLDISNDHVNITLQPSDVVGVQPTWNSSLVSLVPIDGVDTSTLQIPLTMFNQTKLTLTVVFNDVPENRVFNFSLLADGCSLISQPAVLSTHKIQNISVSSPRPGRIRIAWDFVKSRGPTSNRVLVIVYSTSGDTDRAYYHIGKEIQRGKFYTNIRGLPGDKYYVLVFPFEENGKPFERASDKPHSVTVMTSRRPNDNEKRQSYSRLNQLQNGVEVNCTFNDRDDPATTCMAVIHKRITILDYNWLFPIVNTLILERHGNTATGIININLDEYQVGVVKVVQDPIESEGNDQTISITVSVVITATVVIVAITLVVFIVIKRNYVKKIALSKLMKKTPRSALPNTYTHIEGINTSPCSNKTSNLIDKFTQVSSENKGQENELDGDEKRKMVPCDEQERLFETTSYDALQQSTGDDVVEEAPGETHSMNESMKQNGGALCEIELAAELPRPENPPPFIEHNETPQLSPHQCYKSCDDGVKISGNDEYYHSIGSSNDELAGSSFTAEYLEKEPEARSTCTSKYSGHSGVPESSSQNNDDQVLIGGVIRPKAQLAAKCRHLSQNIRAKYASDVNNDAKQSSSTEDMTNNAVQPEVNKFEELIPAAHDEVTDGDSSGYIEEAIGGQRKSRPFELPRTQAQRSKDELQVVKEFSITPSSTDDDLPSSVFSFDNVLNEERI